MKMLVLVATTKGHSQLLRRANQMSDQFDCPVYKIDFAGDGMQIHDQDVLEDEKDRFPVIVIEVSEKTTEDDLATVIREITSRITQPRIIFLGPQSTSVTFLVRFPFIGRERITCYFVDPTDTRRHPDELHRILRDAFPKPQAEKQRRAN